MVTVTRPTIPELDARIARIEEWIHNVEYGPCVPVADCDALEAEYGRQKAALEALRVDRELAAGERVVLFTTAPDSYDGFGTVRPGNSNFQMDGKPLYRCLVRTEHAQWHRMRWSSGCYGSWTLAGLREWEEKWPEAEGGLLRLVPGACYKTVKEALDAEA